MIRWTRRSLLAGAAALAAQPALARGKPKVGREPVIPEPTAQVDVIIVGAGAAGIAAARRLSAAGRSFMMIEASGRIGGRCLTETRSFGLPFDRGAHWIHTPDTNPLTKLASRTGLEIYPAPAGQKVRIGRRYAREGELEDYLASAVRCNRAFADAARSSRADIDCRSLLPRDIGEWRSTLEFALGPYGTSRDLDEISAQDMGRSVERDSGAFCRQGYGALLAKLAQGVPVELNSPLTDVEHSRGGSVVIATMPKGKVNAKYLIITASTQLLASGRIRFQEGLPKRHADALDKLRLGSLDHIALELTGNPLGLQRDDLMIEKSSGPSTAALLANIAGTPLCTVTVGGRFGRDLIGKGNKAAVEFAVEWLSGAFGTDVKRAVQRTQMTNWNAEPWALGASSVASTGGQWARRAMMEPVRGRIFFAGEAVHETMWGTVAGAWESGERAANTVMRRLAGVADEEAPKPKPKAAPAPAPARRGRKRR